LPLRLNLTGTLPAIYYISIRPQTSPPLDEGRAKLPLQQAVTWALPTRWMPKWKSMWLLSDLVVGWWISWAKPTLLGLSQICLDWI